MSPLSIETMVEEDGTEQAEIDRQGGKKLLDNLPEGEPSWVGIGPGQVEGVLVEANLGGEVGAARKSPEFAELVPPCRITRRAVLT